MTDQVAEKVDGAANTDAPEGGLPPYGAPFPTGTERLDAAAATSEKPAEQPAQKPLPPQLDALRQALLDGAEFLATDSMILSPEDVTAAARQLNEVFHIFEGAWLSHGVRSRVVNSLARFPKAKSDNATVMK